MTTIPNPKPLGLRNFWQTPSELIQALTKIYPIALDVCANENNKVCGRYFSEEDDGLSKRWKTKGKYAFCNPPYSQIKRWAIYAREELYVHGNKSLVLLPVDTSTYWWRYCALRATRIILLVGGKSPETKRFQSGRVQFISPPGIAKTTNMWPSSILVFSDPNKGVKEMPETTYFDWRKGKLMTFGK